MKKLFWGVAIVAVVGLIAFVALRKQSQSTADAIKIGVILGTSGDIATWGEVAKKGIELAFEERKNEPGASVEFIYEDSHGESKGAVAAYQKLVNVDKVYAILGPLLQTELMALMPLIEKDGIPVVAPDYVSLENRPSGANPMLVWIDAIVESARMADYVYGKGIRRVAAVGTKDPWETDFNKGFINRFKELGGTVVYEAYAQSDAPDMRSTITEAIQTRPEAIYLSTYYQYINSIKAIRDLRFSGNVYGIELDAYLVSQTPNISNGVQFIASGIYSGDFISKFAARYNEKPGIPAGQAYDATNILFQLIRNSKSRNEMIGQMSKMNAYEGASGKIEFGADRRTLMPTAIFEVVNGEIQKISQ